MTDAHDRTRVAQLVAAIEQASAELAELDPTALARAMGVGDVSPHAPDVSAPPSAQVDTGDARDAADDWIGAIGGIASVVGDSAHGVRVREAAHWIGVGSAIARAILGAIRSGRALEPIPRVEDILPAELRTTIARRAAYAAARERFPDPPDDGGSIDPDTDGAP